ncbi:hypothetical protein PG988_015341 [Apiospora saccharicola]
MASPSGSQQSPSAPGYAYKRASRKGAEKRFRCTECSKVYSRAEHLQRHQLNHNPKVVYKCDYPDCHQAFVRKDLLDRHEKRHSASYQPRNRASSFNMPPESPPLEPPMLPLSPAMVAERQTQSAHQFPQPPLQSAPLNASVLLTPDSDVARPKSHPLPPGPSGPVLPSTAWPAGPMDPANMMRPKPSFMGRDSLPPMASEHHHPPFLPYNSVPISPYDSTMTRDNFAMWLFDPQRSYAWPTSPFFDGGLESAFNNNIHYDHESLTSRSQLGSNSTHTSESSDDLISEIRRHEVLQWVQMFRRKQPSSDALMPNLVLEGGNSDLPGLSLEMMRACVRQFWESVSPRMPIVHQPTFSSNRCAILLLMVMIGLGAASLSSQAPTDAYRDAYREYGPFADLVITYSRWEIVTDNDSAPPTELWVAQALLLVEFYEKMLSNRKLHERAHIYHSVTLTLLRRGSPLIGRAGSESPPDDQVGNENPAATDARTWWSRWADTEAMHRVVYAAFMMDIIHAAMFGHTADMAPHEIRLPLPCDETLWLAASPEKVREQEASLRMYGVKPVSFLDGLKQAIHGKEVQTHSFGRMIIMSGLLSVAWHLNHRETHLSWLELGGGVPSDRREKWSNMLLTAFDGWKTSFDKAMGMNDPNPNGEAKMGANGLIQSAAVLYHLAQFSLYIDIVDCQVYAGAKRLLGRKITTRDFGNVVTRMRTWSNQPSTRHAVLHAFKLLNQVLVDPFQRPRPRYHVGTGGLIQNTQYSCRNDPDPHRPWILYYATLSIWCFVQALGYDRSLSTATGLHHPQQSYHMTPSPKVSLAEYLTSVASLPSLEKSAAASLGAGLPDLLDTVGSLAAESHSELLQEAHGRLEQCREILGRAPQ